MSHSAEPPTCPACSPRRNAVPSPRGKGAKGKSRAKASRRRVAAAKAAPKLKAVLSGFWAIFHAGNSHFRANRGGAARCGQPGVRGVARGARAHSGGCAVQGRRVCVPRPPREQPQRRRRTRAGWADDTWRVRGAVSPLRAPGEQMPSICGARGRAAPQECRAALPRPLVPGAGRSAASPKEIQFP